MGSGNNNPAEGDNHPAVLEEDVARQQAIVNQGHAVNLVLQQQASGDEEEETIISPSSELDEKAHEKTARSESSSHDDIAAKAKEQAAGVDGPQYIHEPVLTTDKVDVKSAEKKDLLPPSDSRPEQPQNHAASNESESQDAGTGAVVGDTIIAQEVGDDDDLEEEVQAQMREAAVKAEEVLKEPHKLDKETKKMWIKRGVFLTLILGGIIVGVVLATSSSRGGDSGDGSSTMPAVDVEANKNEISLLISQTLDSDVLQEDEAANLALEDTFDAYAYDPLSPDDKEAISTHFGLKYLFYSTESDDWEDTTGWKDSRRRELSSEDEGEKKDLPAFCDWFGITCSKDISSMMTEQDSTEATTTASPDFTMDIDLSNNGLSGTLPSLAPLALSRSIRALRLTNNTVSGPLPIEQLAPISSTLQELHLQNNAFTSEELPDPLEFPGIQELRLDGNELRGTIPASWSTLAELRVLTIGNNDLTGPIPGELGDLVNMRK